MNERLFAEFGAAAIVDRSEKPRVLPVL